MSDTPRRRSAELFPTDEPVSPNRLIGRADDVDRVASALLGGGNVVLAGPRRTGKTSVGDAALEICAHEGSSTVSVDLFRFADAGDLADGLARATIATRPALRRALETAGRNLGRLREELSGAATMRARQDLGEEIELALSLTASVPEPSQRLRASVELLDRVAAGDGRRLVLFLDEFQDIASGRFGDPDAVTRQLRAVLQRSARVSVLFAGSIEHLMRDLFAPSERALSQFGAFHELTAIARAEWRHGLRERFAEDACEIDEDALGRLVDLGEQHPRATMLIAQQAHLASVEEISRRIDGPLVAEGHTRALRADRLKHQQTLEKIRSLGRGKGRGTYQVIAQRVARDEALYAGLAPQTASRALEALRDAGIVERTGRRWRIIDPLLRTYLADL